MADEIIRSSKEHEVSIPEGSNNAKSRQSSLGVGEVRTESETSIKAVQEHENRQVAGEAVTVDSERVVVAQDEGPQPNIVSVQEEPNAKPSLVPLPAQAGQEENVISIPSDNIESSRVVIPSDNTSHDQRVGVPSEHITDPSRVIVEEDDVVRSAPALEFPPEVQAEVEDGFEQQPPAVLSEPPDEASPGHSHPAELDASESDKPVRRTQVVGGLSDKWQEEFRGRVVKLREEVDVLNERLDKLEK